MSYGTAGAGTLAAAVLGAGTVAATNTASKGTIRPSSTGSQVLHELARTGVDFTTLLAVLGVVLVLAGVLLVGLTRRHGMHPAGFAPPDLL